MLSTLLLPIALHSGALSAATPTRVPSAAICEDWGRRSSGECDDAIRGTSAAAVAGVQISTPYSLYEQCVLFPTRRSRVEACLRAQDCGAFAICTVSMIDGWDPRQSPDLCTAFLGRKTGVCAEAVTTATAAISGTEETRVRVQRELYGLVRECPRNPFRKAALGECMMEETCADFAACLLKIVETP